MRAAHFAVDREDLFREFLRLENGVPSHDTFLRIFRLLDPSAFAACFGQFVDGLGQAGKGVVAIDGKTLRRSFDNAARRSPLSVVTAFASATQTVIGQESFRAPDGGGHYLLRLKATRPALHEMVVGHFAAPGMLAGMPDAETTDGEHGRIEHRRAFVSHDLDWLKGPKTSCCEPSLPSGLVCLGMIEATVTRNGKTTTTRHYHHSSHALRAED